MIELATPWDAQRKAARAHFVWRVCADVERRHEDRDDAGADIAAFCAEGVETLVRVRTGRLVVFAAWLHLDGTAVAS